jgi:membrane-associated phospholipid phosphatase
MLTSRPCVAACFVVALAAAPRLGLCQAPETAVETLRGEAASGAPHTVRREVPGLADLFKPLGGDFRRLASSGNIGLIQLGATGALTFGTWDRRVRDSGWGAGTTHAMLKPGAVVGGMVFQTSTAVATYALGRATHQPRLAILGADLVRAQLVSQATTQAIKGAVRRTRPDGTMLSFPSGHTASSFATATVLHSHFGWKVGLPAYAMASWVAASRVQMKRHYISDVITGATVGLLAGRSVTFGRGSTRCAVRPRAGPGGGGVSLTRMGGG